MPETLVLAFDPPLEHGGKHDQIKLREPRAHEVFEAEKLLDLPGLIGKRRCDLALMVAVSGKHEDVIKKMPATAFLRGAEFLQVFIDANLGRLRDDELQDEYALPLDPPIEVQDGGADELTLREPTLGEMMKADAVLTDARAATQRNFQMKLVQHCSGLSWQIIKMVPISVLNAAAVRCRGFTVAGRATPES